MSLPEILMIAAVLVAGVAALAFWIWMLVECLTKEKKEGQERIVWLVVIVATKLLGALIYFWVRRPERRRLETAS